jgi:uncharacterized protein YbaR (Trm112 family)
MKKIRKAKIKQKAQFPQYTPIEKIVFGAIASEAKHLIIEKDSSPKFTEGNLTYFSYCTHCGVLNTHNLEKPKLWETKELLCSACGEFYSIKPSPFIIEDKDNKLEELLKKHSSQK